MLLIYEITASPQVNVPFIQPLKPLDEHSKMHGTVLEYLRFGSVISFQVFTYIFTSSGQLDLQFFVLMKHPDKTYLP